MPKKARLRRDFLAVDGEAIDDPKTKEHKYVMLGASTGDRIENLDGLSTAESLSYLSALKHAHPNAILVGFAFGYDVNMILRDVDWETLESLWRDGFVRWRGWRLHWTSGKYFGASNVFGESFRVYDVWGFFQGSFVKALKDWAVGDPETVATIERMKLKRSTFKLSDLPEMRSYMHLECSYLVELCERLRGAFDQAGFQPAGWYGAGAAAAGLLIREGIKAHITPDNELPANVRDVCERAYFGGRVELLLQGEHEQAHSYDIASAYPAALASVPTARGQWRKVRKPRGPLNPNAMYRVEWNVSPKLPIMPFPHRTKRTIYYPSHGSGWYHSFEIEAARVLHPTGITVCEGFELVPDTDVLPFAFVPEVFEERREAKRLGEAREKAYKLALNSLYGKTAQRKGYRDSQPPYRCSYWAGRVTAWTRGTLLLKAAENPSSIISFATDGILATEALTAEDTGDLGSWQSEQWDNLLTVQPGVYFATRDGKPIFKSRGWNAKEINVETLRKKWRAKGHGAFLVVPAQRFVGLGMSIHRNDRSQWRSWPKTKRKLKFAPTRKFPDMTYRPGSGIHRLVHPAGERFNVLSERFTRDEHEPETETADGS